MTLPAPQSVTFVLVAGNGVGGDALIKGLERLGGLECVGQFANIDEALSTIADRQPSVLLLDHRLHAGDVPACRTAREASPRTRIIVLVHYLLPRDHLLALLGGVSACLVKDSYSLRQIKAAMVELIPGAALMKSSLMADLAQSLEHNWPYQFTSDEKRLLAHLVEFRTDTEITEVTGFSRDELLHQVIQIHQKLTLTYHL